MNEKNIPQEIVDDVVVTMQYDLTVDGELVDSSEEEDAIVFIQGRGHIIPGLERELYGMAVGDRKAIHVSAADGYGEIDPDAIQDISRDEFPDDIPLEPGIELELKDNEGELLYATVLSVGKNTVKLDFNEPLAGKDLHFDIEIIDLRAATSEELEHGHVHDHDYEDEE